MQKKFSFNDVRLLVRIVDENLPGQVYSVAEKGEKAAAKRLVSGGYLIQVPHTEHYCPTDKGFKISWAFAGLLAAMGDGE